MVKELPRRLFADMVLVNGKVITVNAVDSIVEAMAVKDGLILEVGSSEEIMRFAGPGTRVVDLDRKSVLPGFIDSHTHPPSAGTRPFAIDCRFPPAKSIRDILRRVKEKAERSPSGKWIRVSNYNDLKLVEKRHITRWELDQAAPQNPVFITKETGHLYVANSIALELAGITKETPEPTGGKIDRDPETGEPTGLLYETAGELVSGHIPPYTLEEVKEGLKHVFRQFLEWGVTTTHDAAADATSIRAYQELLEEGKMPIRVLLMVSCTLLDNLTGLGIKSGFGNDRLKVMSVKIMADGSGAGGSAAVYEPQHRGTKGLGIMVTPPEELKRLAVKAQKAGVRVSIHAIGDRAIDAALDAIEEAQRRKPVENIRHRVEHCSLCTPKQMDRIKRLGVVPSVSIGYMWGIGDDYVENFGLERVMWLHPLRSMINRGIIAAGNSDYAVSTGNPLVQIYEAVTRKTMTGQLVYAPEAISIMEAIRVYTWNGAYIGKEENLKGSIEPGKYADMIVLDRDPLAVSPEEIKDVKILMTIVGGEILYERKEVTSQRTPG